MPAKVIAQRLGNFFYWTGFILGLIFVVYSIYDVFSGEEKSWIGLLLFVIFYFFGFGIRYLLSGKTDHPAFHYFKNLKTKGRS